MSDLLRKSIQVLIGGTVLAFTVTWLSGGCGERIAPVDGPPASGAAGSDGPTAAVERELAQYYESASGTVFSARHTTISSKILARIEAITVRAGDEIEANTVVVRLDSRDLEARLSAARENVTGARAALTLAESERARIGGLFESKVASRRQLDRADAALRMARAALEHAQQGVADAEVGASHAEIRSPVSGRVIDRLAEPGDTAAPGAPLLRVYDPGAMRLEAPVRESLAVRLTAGQPLAVYVESLDLSLKGEIDEIVPAAEPGARTFLIKVRLPHDARLFSGMFGRVRIPAGEGERLRIPRSAVESIGQLEYATVIDGGAASRRMITTGPAVDENDVVVLSGLSEGEHVALW
ncbi:MAG: efflux RND transporter periplasmic adaptor subunit [Deltaproteobacteria bacterium]|nr:efflux RND transporter periplasmic adaptor subunit [Deltaproteobacteria bacterium]